MSSRPTPAPSASRRQLAFLERAATFREPRRFSPRPVGYLSRLLVQVNLPYREPRSCTYERRNGSLSLTLQAPPSVGLPFGRYPRLLLAWIGGEAVRTKSPEIDLGRSLSAAMRGLGVTPNGGAHGPLGRFRDQLRRLLNTTISSTWTACGGEGWADHGFRVASESVLWWQPQGQSGGRLRLSAEFFRELTEHSVPVELGVLEALSSVPAIDLYLFVRYRTFRLRTPTTVPWQQLQHQFGSAVARDRKLREILRRAVRTLVALDPGLPVEEVPEGLLLLPAQPLGGGR